MQFTIYTKWFLVLLCVALVGGVVSTFRVLGGTTINTTLLGGEVGGSVDLQSGLIGHWTFDGEYMDLGSSTAEVLASAGGSNGNWRNHATTTVRGVHGQALPFDGSDDSIGIGATANFSMLGPMSVSAWILPEGHGENGDGRIADKTTGVSGDLPLNGWAFYVTDMDATRGLKFSVDHVTSHLEKTAVQDSITFNQWQLVTVTWDGGTDSSGIHLYVNGQEVGYEYGVPGVGARYSDTASNLTLGNNNSGNRTFDGLLDDVRIYTRVLSQEEIKRLYELGATTRIAQTIMSNDALEATLEGHWTFDGPNVDRSTTSDTYLDSSQNGLHADVTNNTGTLRRGVIGQALEFDGNGTGVSASSFPEYDALTSGQSSVSAWIYPTSLGKNNQGYIVAKATSSTATGEPGGGWALHLTDEVANGITFEQDYTVTHKARTSVANAITLNEWQHVLVTWDGGNDAANTTHIYVNGTEVDYQTTTDGVGAIEDVDTTALTIGRTQGGATNQAFAGRIDDVRVYSSILPQESVTRLFQLGNTTRVSESVRSNQTLESGLIGHWTFDGEAIDIGSSTREVLDRSGQGSHGDWKSHATTTARGALGQALSFDGVNDYVSVADSSGLNFGTGSFTLSVWLQPESLPVSQDNSEAGVLAKVQTNFQSGWYLYFDTSRALVMKGVYAYPSETTIGSDTPVPLNTWSHAVVVFDRSTDLATMYVNGVKNTSDVSIAGASGLDFDANDAHELMFGAERDDIRFFDGAIDDVRIYNRALTAEEIVRLYQMGQ